MNINTQHIDPYTLAFLGVIFTGLNFALLLGFTKRVGRAANRFLALALAVMVLWIVRISAIDIQLPFQFSLAFGPLIFFYVLKLTRPEYRFSWTDALHFIPVLPEQFILQSPLLPLLAIISVVSYLYFSQRLIERFYRRLKFNGGDRYRYELRWLHRLLAGFGILCLLWIVCSAIGYFYYHYPLDGPVYYPFYLCTAITLIWIAVTTYLKPEVGTLINQPTFPKPSPPAELKQKGVWLKNAVKTNKYYMDPELSLSSLADKLGLTTHELSRIINAALKKSFNDLVNEYRVAEVIKRMQDPAYDGITLLGIAYDSGFNSKSTFNLIFKKMIGKTPAEYKASLRKEYLSYNLGRHPQFATVISYHKTTPKWSYDKLNRNYMFRNYLKVAFRNFWRHRLFTLINIVGLSIGISAAVVIYLIARYDLTFDRFYPDTDRIYRVVNGSSDQNGKFYIGGVDGPVPEAVKNEVTGLSKSAPFFTMDEWLLNRTGAIIPAMSGAPLKFKYAGDMILADERYFDIFSYKWLAGAKSSLNKPFTVVLASQRAAKYFPGLSYDQMIGRTVIYGDTIKATVTGIVREHQQNTDFNFNDFLSYSTADHVNILKRNLALQNWGSITPSSQFFVKLADNGSVANVERQLFGLLKKHLPPNPSGDKHTRALRLEKLSDLHFDEQYASWGARTASKTTLYGLLVMAAFLLLLGCINFINLTTAQSVQRAKEIGIRKTMGSSRRELIVQFLSETFLLTLFAVIISCALTPIILKLFADFIPAGVKVDFLQPGLLLFLVLLIIVVSMLSGFYPATVLSAFKPIQVLKNQSKNYTGETRNALLRKTLTVTQFAVAQFFIMATIMVSKQVHYALHKDLGFKKEAILSVVTPWNTERSLMQVYINQLKALPQVERISVGGASPSSDNTHSTGITYLNGKKEVKIDAQERFGDENYINVYGIKLLAGRNIRPDDAGKAFLINASFVKALGFESPADALNISMQYAGKTMRVVGVIGDFYYRSLHTPIQALVVVERGDNTYFSSTLHIALKPQSAEGGDWQRAITGMQTSFKKLYPDNDFQYQFFDDAIAKFYASEQHTSTLLGWATGLSVLISCLGLLGLAIYTTNQRTKEIGVRKVLGATVSQIVVLLSTEMAWLIILAFVIISPVAWWAMNKWMQDFADHTAISWWIFALSGGGMLLTALFTSGFQTIKAALANPVKSLRSE